MIHEANRDSTFERFDAAPGAEPNSSGRRASRGRHNDRAAEEATQARHVRPAGRRIDLSNEEIYELIEFP
jgi:hypothetical protein